MARFQSLSEQGDVRFAEGSHDVRNWSVHTGDEKKVGTVHDIIVDERSRTRFLDVELDGGRHVLMPSGEVRVDPSERAVRVSGLDRNGLGGLPEYDHTPASITPEYSRSVTTAWDRGYTSDTHHERSDYNAGWGTGTGRSATGELARLDDLDDFEVADHEPDPRGWDVVDAAGDRIGKVDHLIGDTGAMQVRYMDVELDADLDSDREHILLPVGHVQLDTDDDRVVARGLDRGRVASFPRYSGDRIDRAYESDLTRQLGEAYTGERHFEHPRYRGSAMDTEEARVERAEEELAVGTREREAGEVDVRKRVETERVREPVKVKHEEVEVERRPASGRGRPEQMGDEEVRIPVREEEVVVAKEPRVKEEVVVRKREVEDTEMVEADVRRERVEVDRMNDETRR